MNDAARPRHSFKIWQSQNSQYYWVYYDGNYEALVTSETYTTLDTAKRMLTNFISEMGQYFKN
jgi:uncharacterized protein YegP (UPF0339 family)